MQPIVQTIFTDLDINETIENALVGSKIENVPTDADYQVDVYATADFFGVEHQIEADVDIAVQRGVVGNTLRKPNLEDDYVASFVVTGGSKLFLRLFETDGVASQTIHTFRLTPLM